MIGQEIARQADKRYIFLEKQEGDLALRRGFKNKKEKVLICRGCGYPWRAGGGSPEDYSRSWRVPVAVTVIVDREGGAPDFSTFPELAALSFPTFKADELPRNWQVFQSPKPGS